MPLPTINNFTVIESAYGKFVVNRHCQFQAEHLIKFGKPHIEDELGKMLAVVATLPADCVVVDAGANIGLVAIPLAQAIRDKGGMVHAFEVQRMMFYALCGGAALNDLENLYVYHQGLGATCGSVRIAVPDYAAQQDFGLFSLVPANQDKIRLRDGIPAEPVDITTIDALRLPRLDFLKIDVEGMEIEVLSGARTMLAQFRPWVWVEYWLVDRTEIKARFEGLPYNFFVVDQLNMLCAPIERMEASRITISAPQV